MMYMMDPNMMGGLGGGVPMMDPSMAHGSIPMGVPNMG